MVLIQQNGKHGEAKQVPFVHPPHSNIGTQLDMEIWESGTLVGANDSLGNRKVSYLSASLDTRSTLPQLH